MSKKKKILVAAAVSGILSIGLGAHANTTADSNMLGKCYGANSCKGKTACQMPNKCKGKSGCNAQHKCGGANGCNGNTCKGQNTCKGKGFLETTKAECDKMAKKNSKIYFTPNE